MLTCLDPVSGKAIYQEERLGAVGDYYASPVAGDGRLYLASQPGVVTVVRASDQFEVLGRYDFGSVIQATPALAGDRLLLRTAGALYAFRGGSSTSQSPP
jgi:outer membrane protein assembly factor BamB